MWLWPGSQPATQAMPLSWACPTLRMHPPNWVTPPAVDEERSHHHICFFHQGI